MELPRKKRRHRQRYANKDPLYITNDDRQRLIYLARYRYLTPELMALLTGAEDKQYSTRRLRQLLDHHYVIQYQDPQGKLPLHWPDFYMLDERGEELLLSEGLHPYGITRLFRNQNDIVAPNFVHDYSACNVMASIEIACQKKGLEFIHTPQILERVGPTASIKLPCTVSHTFPNGSRQTINDHFIPDGLFGIRLPEGKVSFFALELEKGTPIEPTQDLKRASFLKKILAYRDVHQKKQHVTQLGIPNLRTLFVTKSPARVNSMLLTTQRVIGETNQFLFTHSDPAKPNYLPDILDREWQRAGTDPTFLI